MRLYFPLLATKGNPRGEKVPFQEILPMKIRNRVSGKGNNATEVCCIYEMSVMLACLKDNDYNQPFCSKEINNFKNCYMNHLETKNIRKERDQKGILTPGEKKLTHKQLNVLLKKYPNIE